MKRKLVVLNVVLALLAAYAGWQLRQAWLAAKARETATLVRKVKPAPPPPFTPLPVAPPVIASGYADIVQKTLFDRSRNPTVVVELPPPPPPPPPKPVPPLPFYHGVMNLGDGITAVLSVAAGSPHQAVHPGEPIGDFKLVSVNEEEIAFEWDGQTIRKKIGEMAVDTTPMQQAAAAAPAVRTEAAAPAAPAAVLTPTGPGTDIGGGVKACDTNDSTPAGAVVGGYRKMITPTPMGPSCKWFPVDR